MAIASLVCDMLVVDHRYRSSSSHSLERATLLGFHRWAFSANESEAGSGKGRRGSDTPTVISPRLLQTVSKDGGEAGTRVSKLNRPAKLYGGQLEMHLAVTTLLEELQVKSSDTQDQHCKTSQLVDKICGQLKVLNQNSSLFRNLVICRSMKRRNNVIIKLVRAGDRDLELLQELNPAPKACRELITVRHG